MLTDHELIARQKAAPALLRLHRALTRLGSVTTVMNTGAHPDDEQSGLLAFLRHALGMRVVIACSTRGEGGQNALGPERGAALGVLRTREMEEAARELDADIDWLGHGPDDPVHDFGFSRDGDDTLRRWGSERIAERLVRTYRRLRPDIVIPTFLDVPGQHGHHRAMTRMAREAVALAADPDAFPEHFGDGLKPWRVEKFYLPAWSGGGATYDDEVLPPAATLRVAVEGPDAVTGAAFDQIGEWSRRHHASQGMGVWKDDPRMEWPLHLVVPDRGEEADIRDGLVSTLGDLADEPVLPGPVSASLRDAQAAIDATLAAFPDRERILAWLLQAAAALEHAQSAASPRFLDVHGHRLARKRAELDCAILEARGLAIRAFASPAWLAAGAAADLFVSLSNAAAADDVAVEPATPPDVSSSGGMDEGGRFRFRLHAAPDAAATTPYPASWSSLGGNGAVHVQVAATIGGRRIARQVDLEEPMQLGPRNSGRFCPDALVRRLGDDTGEIDVGLQLDAPETNVSFSAPPGWRAERRHGGIALSPPHALAAGVYRIVPLIEGRPMLRRQSIAYPHVGRAELTAPEVLRILALQLALPADARVAYVGAGADRVGLWLARMGVDVVELEPGMLDGDLSGFTTMVIGILAYGLRSDLAASTRRLHGFVEAGGHLVTLYHRPVDGWIASSTPPRPLEIGSPSLRWRVTDPAAPVSVLAPAHKLLSGPNRIGPEDWTGWDKERGLYFASRWDAAYEPLLSMHDAGEAPLRGALLSAVIGRGRHTHTSLALHHQLDRLVPGAFRLLANLVQPAG
jgi:LmbE family N-acetylglucosaminyl deacetylase